VIALIFTGTSETGERTDEICDGMWAIGVKTAATCDTIDGPSVKGV
jgi:hypothetical protein